MSENGYKLRRTKERLATDYLIQTARWYSTRYWLADRKHATRDVVPATTLRVVEPKRDQKSVRTVNKLARDYEEDLRERGGFNVALGYPQRRQDFARGWVRSVESAYRGFATVAPQCRADADFSTHIEECFDHAGSWIFLPTGGAHGVLLYVVADALRAVLMPIVGKEKVG